MYKNINEIYFDVMEEKFLTRTITKPTLIQYDVNDKFGSGTISRVILNRGLEFCIGRNKTMEKRILSSVFKDISFIEINYCLAGEVQLKDLETKKECFSLKAGEVMFHTNKIIEASEYFIMDTKNYTGIIITLESNELRKYFFDNCQDEMLNEWEKCLDKLFKKDNDFITKTPLSIEWDIKELLNYNYNFKKVTSLLLCQSKLIEIISKSVEYGLSRRQEINLSKSDEDEINRAKEILIGNIESPPSIKELSKMCNINSYKLKKGFKELFDNTPYGYLREFRIYKGRYLLESTEKSIAEIANIVGYTNPSKFSEAFKSIFNITPSEYRKNK